MADHQQVAGGDASAPDCRRRGSMVAPGAYTIQVEVRLLRVLRARARGIITNRSGHIAGARRRARRFHAGSRGADKASVLREIRSRYERALGGNRRKSSKHPGPAKAALWRSIRDEVLFQHEYIAKLPARVKRILHESVKDSQLIPANYDQLFRIARAIERMPSAQVNDYVSKVSATTTDLNALESSLRHYSAAMAKRAKSDKETPEPHSKYQAQQGLGADQKASRRTQLEKQLAIHGFASIAAFESFIRQYEKAFEREAANIAKDYLDRYAGLLYRESKRYQKPREIYHLHENLSGWTIAHPAAWARSPDDPDDSSWARKPVAAPRTWLLRTGWRRGGGPISPNTVPGLPKGAPALPVW